MSKKQAASPKRIPSKWERESRRRLIVQMVIIVAIVSVLAIVGYGYYDTHVKPWHQAIVRVNDETFDMRYFVKMFRLWGASGQDPTQDAQLAPSVATVIQNNELVKQEARRQGISLSQKHIEQKIKDMLSSSDPEMDEATFQQTYQEILKQIGFSDRDFREMFIEPMLFQDNLRKLLGDEQYPQDALFQHVNVQAILLGIEEQASQARSFWEAAGDSGFASLLSASPNSPHYPTDTEEWLPRGIESAAFDESAFAEGSENIGISQPLRDLTRYTTGGYWLIEVLEERGEGDAFELHIKGMLLDSNAKAQEIKARMDGGESFDDIAKEESLHSSSKESGGDMGWLTLASVKSQFGQDNYDSILALSQNVISDPPIYSAVVSKQSGYWLTNILAKEDRALTLPHRESLASNIYNDWLEEASSPEKNRVESYLDDAKIYWAIGHIAP